MDHGTGQKLHILERFMRFVTKRVAAAQLRIASLGGNGLEAEVWAKAGVQRDSAYLIERSRKLSRVLIHGGRFQYTKDLRGFPAIFQALHPDERLDAFHLDLNGTLLSQYVRQAQPIVAMVIRSQGCLAITEADQRRNLSIEQYPVIKARLAKRLRQGVHSLYHAFLHEQKSVEWSDKTTSPTKGAQKELGTFEHVLALFRLSATEYAIPDEIQRFVYVSRHRHGSWRMRTYFFRFGSKRAGNLVEATRLLHQQWVANPLHFKPEEIQEEVVSKMASDRNESKLAALVSASNNPEIQVEYEDLAARAAIPHISVVRRERALGHLRDALEMLMEDPGAIVQESPVNDAETPVEAKEKPARKRRRSRRRKKAVEPNGLPEPPKNGDLVYVQLQMLFAAAGGKLDQFKNDLRTRFNVSKHSAGRVVGAWFARTQKKFRPDFVARVIENTPADKLPGVLAKVARAYSKLTGVEVSADQLKAEARKFNPRANAKRK